MYEPGSTFKLVTIAAALEEKLTRPDELFDCQMGSIVINGMRIRDSKPHGLLPVSEFSPNPATWAPSRLRCALGKIDFINTFAPLASGSRPESNFLARPGA